MLEKAFCLCEGSNWIRVKACGAGIGFWVVKGLIWLSVKACGAWDAVFGG
jgi:hypothetical protein